MSKVYLLLALAISFSLNGLALYTVIKFLKRYSHIKDDRLIDRSIRKAYVSRKKHKIVSSHIRRIRGSILKLSLFQFLIPMITFIASIILYISIALTFYPYGDPLIIYMDKPCLAPIPIQFPSEKGCLMHTSWLFFLVFLLYLPLYTYYTRKYLETPSR